MPLSELPSTRSITATVTLTERELLALEHVMQWCKDAKAAAHHANLIQHAQPIAESAWEKIRASFAVR